VFGIAEDERNRRRIRRSPPYCLAFLLLAGIKDVSPRQNVNNENLILLLNYEKGTRNVVKSFLPDKSETKD